jgi:hypothetical protein
MAAAKTLERELRDAIKRSGLPHAAINLYRAILDAADFTTAELPDRFQPRSLDELAEWAAMSVKHCKQMLNVLEEHDWIERKRPATPGRGHRTAYVLLLGTARERRGRPLTDAERARRYRQRKAAADSVTENGTEMRDKAAPKCVTKRHLPRDGAAGHRPFSAEGQRGEKEGRGMETRTVDTADADLPAPDGFMVELHRATGWGAGWAEHEGPRELCRLPHPATSARWTPELDEVWLAGGPSSPRCAGCGGPMDPVLSEAGMTTHPLCGDSEVTAVAGRPGEC